MTAGWVLLVFALGNYASPGVATERFASQAACEAAAEWYRSEAEEYAARLARQRASGPKIKATCVRDTE